MGSGVSLAYRIESCYRDNPMVLVVVCVVVHKGLERPLFTRPTCHLIERLSFA